MKEDRYSSFSGLIQSENDKLHSAQYYTYESTGGLYDVIVIPELQERYYRTDTQLATPNKYHKAIEQYYHI